MDENENDLVIGGLVPFSTVDWPGMLAAVVFTRGCPWDCVYCHNPHLLAAEASMIRPLDVADVTVAANVADVTRVAEAAPSPAWPDVLAFLDARRGLLDGVVFSGGEPTAQYTLETAIQAVRARGFAVALHTNGAYPERLRALLPLLAWVGLDIKAPSGGYRRITGAATSAARAFESLTLLVTSGIPYEVRTTVHPDLLGSEDLCQLADQLEAAGVTHWAIQAYHAEGTRPGLRPARLELADLPKRVRAFAGELVFREA